MNDPWKDIRERIAGEGMTVDVEGHYHDPQQDVSDIKLLLADADALLALRDPLLEIKELLRPDSGYHISPDDGPEGLGELMRIGSIFERADNALAALPAYLKGE